VATKFQCIHGDACTVHSMLNNRIQLLHIKLELTVHAMHLCQPSTEIAVCIMQ